MHKAALVVAILLTASAARAEKEFPVQKSYRGFTLGTTEAALKQQLDSQGFRCWRPNAFLVRNFPSFFRDNEEFELWCKRDGDEGEYGFDFRDDGQGRIVFKFQYKYKVHEIRVRGRSQAHIQAFLREFRWMTFFESSYGFLAQADEGVSVRLYGDAPSLWGTTWRATLTQIPERYWYGRTALQDAAIK